MSGIYPPKMRGATAGVKGTAGLVPPASAGQQAYILLGDGTWGAQPVAGLPSQTNNSGKLLTTNGTDAAWSGAVTVSGNNATVSGTLASTGDFAVNTDKFTVAASSGNTVVAGTLTASASAIDAILIGTTGGGLRFGTNRGCLYDANNYGDIKYRSANTDLFSLSSNMFGGNTYVGVTMVASTREFAIQAASSRGIYLYGNGQSDASYGLAVNGSNNVVVGTNLSVSGTTDSTSTTTGSLITAGGLGVAKAAYIGGNLTVSGSLSMNAGAATAGAYLSADAGQWKWLQFSTAGSSRWIIACTNAAESGSDAGSSLEIRAYTDSGVYIDAPIILTRAANAAIAFGRPIRLANAYAAGAPTATGYLTVQDSNGTTYKIPAVAA